MKSKCIQVLMAEHKAILSAADVLRAMAETAADTGRLNREDVTGMLEILRVFADSFHQGKEEGALFPIYTALCDRAEIDAVRHMALEHEQDRSLVEGMEDALLRANALDFSKYATHLEEALRTHIYKEDNFLFTLIDQGLPPEHDRRILRAFEAYDDEFKAHGEDRLRHRLRMLEWKYVRKAA